MGKLQPAAVGARKWSDSRRTMEVSQMYRRYLFVSLDGNYSFGMNETGHDACNHTLHTKECCGKPVSLREKRKIKKSGEKFFQGHHSEHRAHAYDRSRPAVMPYKARAQRLLTPACARRTARARMSRRHGRLICFVGTSSVLRVRPQIPGLKR